MGVTWTMCWVGVMSPAGSWPDIFIVVSSAGSHRGIDRLVIGNTPAPPP